MAVQTQGFAVDSIPARTRLPVDPKSVVRVWRDSKRNAEMSLQAAAPIPKFVAALGRLGTFEVAVPVLEKFEVAGPVLETFEVAGLALEIC